MAYFTKPLVQLNPGQSYDSVFSYVLRRMLLLNDRENINFDDLLNRVKRERCETSFRALFDHFYSRVLSYFKNGGVAGEKASDLAQETLLAVWHKVSFFDASKGSCGTWIFTIARNLRYDHFRASGKDVLNIAADDLYDQLDDSSLSLDERFFSDEIRLKIDSLPVEQKEAVYAMYFEGYSHGEYAELKKIPLGTVKSRIRLALSQLKKRLEEL